jgi:hypothetical protein
MIVITKVLPPTSYERRRQGCRAKAQFAKRRLYSDLPMIWAISLVAGDRQYSKTASFIRYMQ